MEVATTLDALARRYVWWQSPDRTLSRRAFFLCQLMQLATLEDLQAARSLVGDDAFRAALRAAPAGVLEPKSWTFWHRFWFQQSPPPPLPVRPLPP